MIPTYFSAFTSNPARGEMAVRHGGTANCWVRNYATEATARSSSGTRATRTFSPSAGSCIIGLDATGGARAHLGNAGYGHRSRAIS